MKTNYLKVALLFIPILVGCSSEGKHYPEALSPQEEVKKFSLENGFQVLAVATEPLISMPVSMTIDENGHSFVVELTDYPVMQSPTTQPNGKSTIKELQDTNLDGVYDTAFIFATHITDVTSVLPYKGGLLVAAAPNILYMKDTNADHKADLIDTLFTGFFTGNSEAQITNLTYGVDNWIYANNTGQAGEITFLKNPKAPKLAMGGHDFRFRLDKGLFEAESGTGQFGLAIDDWNHRYYTQNSLHIQTNPIRWRYLHRHDFMPSYNGDYNISDHESEMFQLTPPPYWRKVRTQRRQKQYDSLHLNQKEWAEGHFTGASGATFYGGDAFPEQYYGSIFTGEVAGNLIHRDVISYPKDQVTMVASRSDNEKDKEFLASSDSWTRPTSFYSGPDGNLFIIDMYRQHIETPVAIPEDLKKDMDFTAGNDKGRIYLISVRGPKRKPEIPNLGSMSSVQLVPYLAHPNNWFRTQAQRLLVERMDKSVLPAVRNILETNKDARFRLRALYTLEGLDALTAAEVKRAIKDPEPGVRENAAMLAESFPALQNYLAGLLNDPVNAVAFQAIQSIGNMPASFAIPLLISTLEKHAADSLYNVAILSSIPGSSYSFLDALKKQGQYFNKSEKYKLQFAQMVGFIFGARNQKSDIAQVLGFFSDPLFNADKNWLISLLQGLVDGLDSRDNNKLPADAFALLKKLLPAADKNSRVLITNLLRAASDAK